jgi:nucleoside-diphosphate-sugar epimerase
MAGKVALVAGASGIIGRGLLDVLCDRADWEAAALGRRQVEGVRTIAADLRNRTSALEALRMAGRDVTHVFYAAYLPAPDLAAEVAVNGPMLANLLDGLVGAGAPVERVVLYQGAKVYGVHLGPVRAPFREDGPRHLPPNFYYTQEDELHRRAAAGGPGFSILRPDVVVGDAVGNPMNIATVIGAFAAISRATGTPLRFPGPVDVYERCWAQVTDSRMLGRASLWAATADAARGEAFNYVHEPFRWQEMWTQVADGLGLPVGPPMPMNLAKHMGFQGEVWGHLVAKHGLRPIPYEELVGWGFGDFVFNARFDVVSDMGKIRRAGFAETTDSAGAILDTIGRLQAAKVLP